MLFFETTDTGTLELLIKLQSRGIFSDLRLVGGTALALQIGHRKSVDIDLFGSLTADDYEISKQLTETGEVTILRKTANISIYLIEGLKVDIVNYHYPWLEGPVTESGLKLAGMKDISAMKLAAITGRGTKKDFVDLFFLLRHFTLKQMLEFYSQKYSDGSEFLVLKSLAYFEDANTDEDPVMLMEGNWLKIKLFIQSALEDYIRREEVSD
jgi:hypothetical protein